jgi:V/A-type H+-transporting ATPase subunit D
MPTPRDVIPTRSVLLELKEEQRFTRDGHELLDQKRMLLAAETLRWLGRYEQLRERLVEAQRTARKALAEAVSLHGVEELGVHPAGQLDLDGLHLRIESFLGITIARVESKVGVNAARPAERAVNPSPEARRCRERHVELVELALEAALVQGNILRLLSEYRRTERRANALENVVLPELALTVGAVEENLEEQDQEEAARFRRNTDQRRQFSQEARNST